ncbi:hypothetical protein AKJ57_02395 [candidate division MSBL1 archaeon SCGC-AAA259A05]|uniref:Electron transfer flavoprotein alpha/beta-subunit N-terminal domain-containing protein n=1 Tax=candidate division MSBL1 archaeon SCGC-AAA259A05 TaxID=1698259 RepID=A0A133UAB8_9EURY|nr:hypothetical protein AKJ57_02395 [candidate division MSBL1 archaeon SCGC-AAA259A05]
MKGENRGSGDSPTVVVPIKQVPDMDEVEFDRERGRIDRSTAEAEPNPFDLNALEEAVLFKEELGGEVITISMGPPQAESALRDSLARGADRAILLSDKAFGGADTWATALTLSIAIRKLESYDLIICGEKTVDGDTGQVGPEIAELLGIPHAAYVSGVTERDDGSIKVNSDVWGKTFTRKLDFPGLITVTKDVNMPRIPLFRDKKRAREAEIETWGLEDLDVDEEKVGFNGSPTSVKEIEIAPEVNREGKVFKGEVRQATARLLRELSQDRVVEGAE